MRENSSKQAVYKQARCGPKVIHARLLSHLRSGSHFEDSRGGGMQLWSQVGEASRATHFGGVAQLPGLRERHWSPGLALTAYRGATHARWLSTSLQKDCAPHTSVLPNPQLLPFSKIWVWDLTSSVKTPLTTFHKDDPPLHWISRAPAAVGPSHLPPPSSAPISSFSL